MKRPCTMTNNNAALYMRLSRDDESYGDSVSIETQRTLLRSYAKEHSLNVVDEYIDDGWSGTNFDRPSFQRMMRDVENGIVNCIVTKDLSRFGREHVMMGYYLDFLFPEKHVRYIAIAEGEDTEKGLSDFVPFKNLFNEWYAKDTSRKVKAAFKAKFAAGQYVSSCAPIGYKKDPTNKNRLIPDEDTRWIIEKIFDLASHGNGAFSIAKQLRGENVPTSGWLNYQKSGAFANIYANAPEEKHYMWTPGQVKKILTDEVYIGNSIHNRQSTVSFKNKRRILNPKEEWYRVENTHEAIIPKDVFCQVQKQIASRRRRQKTGDTQIFAGLIKCADCGRSLAYATKPQGNETYGYYRCGKYVQGLHQCTMHYIRYDVLYAYVLSRLQYWSSLAQCDEAKFAARISSSVECGKDGKVQRQNDELKRLKKRNEELDILFAKLYEDRVCGRITERNFDMLSAKYQAEQASLDENILHLQDAISAEAQNTSNAQNWFDLIKKYRSPTELTAELLNALIEKIVVHEAVKQNDGTREQEVEIYYRFIGKID